MKKTTLGVRIGALVFAGIATLAAVASAKEPDNAVFSQVMRAMSGKACPLISDAVGNAGPNPIDFKNLFVANDQTNVYFLVELAGDASKNTLSPIWLDTDLNQTTGCTFPGLSRFSGLEYGVFLQTPAFGGFIGDMTGCAAGSTDFGAASHIRVAYVGHFMAAIVPISTLQILTPLVDGFAVSFNGGGNFGPAIYLFQ